MPASSELQIRESGAFVEANSTKSPFLELMQVLGCKQIRSSWFGLVVLWYQYRCFS
jgi:hypothetical protein